jgi:hypothetical protein
LSVRDGGAIRKCWSVEENRVGCIVRGILSSHHSLRIIQFVAEYTYIVIPRDEVEFTKRAKNLDLCKCAASVWMGEAKEGQATEPARLDRRLEINVRIDEVYAEGRRSERQSENPQIRQQMDLDRTFNKERQGVPPQKRRPISVYKRIIRWPSLHIATSIQKRWQRHTKEHVGIVDHLFVLQTSCKSKVADVERLRYSGTNELNEAGEDRESCWVE